MALLAAIAAGHVIRVTRLIALFGYVIFRTAVAAGFEREGLNIKALNRC